VEVKQRQNLRDLSRAETETLVAEIGAERYRADQIFRWVHGRAVSSVDDMTDLNKALRTRLSEKVEIRGVTIASQQISRDGTRKLALKTYDDRVIETVLIPDGDASAPDDDLEGTELVPPVPQVEEGSEFRGGRKRPPVVPEHLRDALFPQRPKLTQCISSQVGCALDCRFCATATLGFGRNLTAGEIVDQVYRAEQLIGS
jgi:23S rRNA (adenine2503-C2)-methyltransferase